jgi:hypothetical protein
VRVIAVTTIASQASPGIAKLIKLAEICSAELVIIGDKKTPAWDKEKLPAFAHYFSIDDQIKKWPNLATLLPFNHYARKNLAYLWAIENKASVLLDTDDDNSSEVNVFENVPSNYRVIGEDIEWVNVYGYFGKNEIWPRGLPLDEARKELSATRIAPVNIEWHCFQSIVDGDPDLDAIGRMLHPESHNFLDADPLLLTGKNFCPTNSQATLWKRPLLPLLYLPVTSSFRMTDIWRGIILSGYIRQSSLSAAFGKLGFTQERNVHNLVSDFLDEVSGHEHNRSIKKISDDTWQEMEFCQENWASGMSSIYTQLVEKDLLYTLDLECLLEFTKTAENFLGNK